MREALGLSLERTQADMHTHVSSLLVYAVSVYWENYRQVVGYNLVFRTSVTICYVTDLHQYLCTSVCALLPIGNYSVTAKHVRSQPSIGR